MRRCIFALWFLCIPSLVYSQVVLNEVYYDHPGRDDGHEFIELINVTSSAVRLAGYSLEFHDGNSALWKTVWQASALDSIPASALFVVGGDSVFPRADVVVTLALQNGPDAVRLVQDGIELDRVGYGDLVDPAYFERRSAPDVPAGSSLARWPDGVDTDDNAEDFRVLEPSPARFNRPRRDIAVTPGMRTSLRGVLPLAGVDEITFRLRNRGTEPVVDTLTVELVDSTQTSARVLDVREIPDGLAPGDSVEVEFTVTLAPGYHTLTAVVAYAADDRPANNRSNLVRRVGSPLVLVSEVMSHPAAGCPEYVEIYNAGPVPYDIVDHWIKDRANSPAPITYLPTPVAPGGFVVITPDRAALRACFPALTDVDIVEVTGGWPSLNHASGGNAADSVTLFDRFLLAVDRVTYPAQPGESRGRSLERLDLYPGQRVHTWMLSTSAGGGSPARPNPVGILEEPRGSRLSLSSNPFDPTAGGPLVITLPPGVGGAIVYLFDVRGGRVRDLGATSQLPFVFTWDGTDDRGRVVTPGLYIVACEYLNGTGGRSRVEKVVLGCARGFH